MSIPRLPIAVVACLAMALAGCSSGSTSKGDDAKSSSEVTLTNCGNKVTYPKVAQRLYVNDGNIIAMALSAGAAKQIAAVSSLGDDKTILAAKYGSHVIDNLHEAVKGYPTLESIIANKPDVVVAGWNYGFSEEGNLTPDKLHERGIGSYLLSESCRQKGSEKARGVMQPWDAVRTDLGNLAKLTGNEPTGKKAVKDLDDRLDALNKAPKAARTPVVLLFDSAKDTVLTSGSKGGPQAMPLLWFGLFEGCRFIPADGVADLLPDPAAVSVDAPWPLVSEADYRAQFASEAAELTQHYPRPGWVEHDAKEIWNNTRKVTAEALAGRLPEPVDVHRLGQRGHARHDQPATAHGIEHDVVGRSGDTAGSEDVGHRWPQRKGAPEGAPKVQRWIRSGRGSARGRPCCPSASPTPRPPAP